MEEFVNFIREKKRRKRVKTAARVQPFCGKNIKTECFNGKETTHTNITEET